MPLVLAGMTMMLLSALGAALALGTIAETAIAASYRDGTEAFYATEAAVEFVLGELTAAPDWDGLLAGEIPSGFVDGPPEGLRGTGTGAIDLAEETADVNDIAGEATYRLYAYGWFSDLVPTAAIGPPLYVVVWIADLSGGVVGALGRAYGPTGSRRSIAVSVARTAGVEGSTESLELLSWHELR